ncbi:hypothetical protein GRI89_04330 [Altererythrobacter salegens]|uniref:Argininosuccinate lyase n=1 Tax=Croceibacterium salegens TaxID=1737568 RepID=A0A6I4SVD7_9SPHN|nr:hypothetical protein [Croceibacterium salegens]MXO58766.1 hypothetical protein [Croceibacterium salegens]
MRKLGVVLGLAAAFVAAPLSAQMYEKISIVNSTGYTIEEISIAPSSSNSWEEDVLDDEVLDDGEEFRVDFRRAENTCDWDLKVVYDDGEEATWDSLDMCENWHFELFYNAKTGDTHLTSSH